MTSSTQLKHFLPLSKLGQGAFSTVYKVKRTNDGFIYALKKIKIHQLSDKQKINALNQIRILASIKSNYIISYKEAFYDTSLSLLCIVMEYANCGDLQKNINQHKKNLSKFTQKDIWKAAAQILVGLHVLHQKGILHRDLKSANVFVSNENYKLGDLNVSKINDQKDQMARTQTGTPYYASPQVWRDQPYDSKCDIWSFGCLIYEMCCFQPPFQGQDLDQLYKAVQRGRFRQIPKIYSQELGTLIKQCLQINPKYRPSSEDLFKRFKKLNQKYIECVKVNEFGSDSKLINTIHLPLDMRELSKKLPMSEYQTIVKNQPQTIYFQDPQNKQTVMLKNKSGVGEHQIIQPLPERIKKYFNNKNQISILKRPQRPITSSKQKHTNQNQNHSRPSSAHIKKIRNEQQNNLKPIDQNKLKLHKIRTEHQIHPLSLQKKCPLPPKVEAKPLPSIIKNPYNPNQYRCKSAQSQKNHQVISRMNSPKQKITQIQNKNIFSTKKTMDPSSNHEALSTSPIMQKNLSINKKLYENCKENSLKKISSLENKVKYIRDQRKERKVMLQKNKQNLSCILKSASNQERLDMKQCLKDKIKQNLQIFRSRPYEKAVCMPIIKQRVNSAVSVNKNQPIGQSEVLKVFLQKRKNYSVAHRYIVSADNKRIRSFTQISNDQISNGQMGKDVVGIKKAMSQHVVSALVNRGSSVSNYTGDKQNIKKGPLKDRNFGEIVREDISLIENSEAILRLKKRIKSRMIGHGNEVRNYLRAEKININKMV